MNTLLFKNIKRTRVTRSIRHAKRRRINRRYVNANNLSSKDLIKIESEHAAQTYYPIPVVVKSASGVFVWDVENKKYFDFLSAYSALNQGHNHPRIVKALLDQVEKCALTSRAFYNSVFPQYANFITKLFGYQRVLPMNGGAEAVDTSIKLARRWGHLKKNIDPKNSILISCKGCFHGRTYGAISLMDEDYNLTFGPLVKGIKKIKYNSIPSLQKFLESNAANVCAFIVEPIQGEAGVVVPDEEYIKQAYDLCKKHNVLFIADEIQTGLGRTGKLLASEWYNIKPDILILGKALSGGMLPISAVLADDDIMLNIKVGEHGSTYGGNPLASAVAIEALKVIVEEKLPERALKLGSILEEELKRLKRKNSSLIKTVRGKGLFHAIVFHEEANRSAWDLCLLLKSRGLLAKPTHENKIRLAPPLIITEEQLKESVGIISGALKDIQTMEPKDIPGYIPDHH